MQSKLVDPKRSLVVILGASVYPKAPSLTAGLAFVRSKWQFYSYLIDKKGLGIPHANILDLFDDSRFPGDQLEEVATFISTKQNSGAAAEVPENLFIYYVGHGLFTSDRKYCFAVRCTNENNIGFSAIRGRDLADVIREQAVFFRRFLILDCCFASSMYGEFLSAPGQAATTQLLESLPERGTSLLCASSPQDVALAPANGDLTMFSDSLLKALSSGNPSSGPRMSLSELGAMVRNILRRDYPSNWVRPEIHTPDMREGDIALLPIFPNPAWTHYTEAEEGTDLAQETAKVEAEEAEATEVKATEEEAEAVRRTAHTRADKEAEDARKLAEIKAAEEEAEAARRTAQARADKEAEDARKLALVRAKQVESETKVAQAKAAEDKEREKHSNLYNRLLVVMLLIGNVTAGTLGSLLAYWFSKYQLSYFLAKLLQGSISRAPFAYASADLIFILFICYWIGRLIRLFGKTLESLLFNLTTFVGDAMDRFVLISTPGFLIGFLFLNTIPSGMQPRWWYAVSGAFVLAMTEKI
ncbi:MAG TPA: hypothetical protein VK638_43795 [Edaphobacter sp.]|nr:hypothetical protein [Edaphobacter sp.]